MTRELARKQELVLLLSRSAEERVVGFLIDMVQRASPREDDLIDLPMSRQDIADYLGLTIETISRVRGTSNDALQLKSQVAIPLCCVISLRTEEAKRPLNFSKGLRADDQRRKPNFRNGSPPSRARLLRYLDSRLCLAGVTEHGPDLRARFFSKSIHSRLSWRASITANPSGAPPFFVGI